MKEAIIRSITGIVFASLVILSFVLHPVGYIILFSIICAGAWLEMGRMFPAHFPKGLRIPVAIFISGSFILAYFAAGAYLETRWFLLPPILLVLTTLPAGMFVRSVKIKSMLFLLGAVIYILAGFSMLHLLAFLTGTETEAVFVSGAGNGYSPRWIIFTFIFLWMNDTMAYVSGRLTGKHPVWPSVSPAKTWEGSLGGALFTFGLALVFSRYYPDLSTGEWSGFAGIVILFGSLGDFFESWLKRKAGVKDSGRLLPGHGGILDRFDSLLLSLPFVTLYLNLIQ